MSFNKQAYMKEYRDRPESRARAREGDRWRNLLRTYGVTRKVYELMLSSQNNACMVCGEEQTRIYNGRLIRLAVDHNHQTGELRGLLCDDCNKALGLLQEDTDRMMALIDYVLAFRTPERP